MTRLNTGDLFLIVRNSPEDIYTFTVRHADVDQFPHVETVDLGPNPTWPSPVEANDAIGEAVVKVLDVAWEAATGQGIERDPSTIASTYANQKDYLTRALAMLKPDDLVEVLTTALNSSTHAEYNGRGGFDGWAVEADGDNWDIAINPAQY